MTRQIGPRLGFGCDSKYCGDATMDALIARHPLDDDVAVDELVDVNAGAVTADDEN